MLIPTTAPSLAPTVVPRCQIRAAEYGNPLGAPGLKPLVVPNQALPGQTSGLSWCVHARSNLLLIAYPVARHSQHARV